MCLLFSFFPEGWLIEYPYGKKAWSGRQGRPGHIIILVICLDVDGGKASASVTECPGGPGLVLASWGRPPTSSSRRRWQAKPPRREKLPYNYPSRQTSNPPAKHQMPSPCPGQPA